MANNSNLKSLSTRSPQERKAIAQKGGKVSVKKRAELKTIKEELLLLLAEGDTQKKISLALIQKALNGDIKAFEVIRDSIGQKVAERVEVTQTIDDSVREIEEYIKGNKQL